MYIYIDIDIYMVINIHLNVHVEADYIGEAVGVGVIMFLEFKAVEISTKLLA